MWAVHKGELMAEPSYFAGGGEVFGLTVDRPNTLRREVTIDGQLVKLAKPTATCGRTRTTGRGMPSTRSSAPTLAHRRTRYGPRRAPESVRAGQPMCSGRVGL